MLGLNRPHLPGNAFSFGGTEIIDGCYGPANGLAVILASPADAMLR